MSSTAETIQPSHATLESPAALNLVLTADRGKLTRWDDEILARGDPLETVGKNGQVIEVHETNNLFRNLETLELPAGDPYRQAFEPVYEQLRFKELLKRVQNNNPGLLARARHLARQGARDLSAIPTPEQSAAIKVCMSELYEAMCDAAPTVFEGESQSKAALDSLV